MKENPKKLTETLETNFSKLALFFKELGVDFEKRQRSSLLDKKVQQKTFLA